MHFVVFSPGRTGSQLIANNIRHHYKCAVVHTHNPMYNPLCQSVAIISKRRNMFNALMSAFVSQISGEFFSYTANTIYKVTIPNDAFRNRYIFYKVFYEIVNLNYFDRVIDIFYEDMVNDATYLFSHFGVDKDISMQLSPKSPYDYSYITNIDQLRILYDEYEKTPLSSEIIENVKWSIEKDLLEIRTKYNGNKPI